jgi:hypothetical protein
VGSDSAVGGPCTRATRINPELWRGSLVAWLPPVRLFTLMTFWTPTVGYANAMVVTTVDVPPVYALTAQSESSAIPFESGGDPCVGQAETVNSLAILLRIRDTARVPHDVLTKAQGDVTRIYREAGVEVLWATAESLSGESTAVRQAALTVAILTLRKAERLDADVMEPPGFRSSHGRRRGSTRLCDLRTR